MLSGAAPGGALASNIYCVQALSLKGNKTVLRHSIFDAMFSDIKP